MLDQVLSPEQEQFVEIGQESVGIGNQLGSAAASRRSLVKAHRRRGQDGGESLHLAVHPRTELFEPDSREPVAERLVPLGAADAVSAPVVGRRDAGDQPAAETLLSLGRIRERRSETPRPRGEQRRERVAPGRGGHGQNSGHGRTTAADGRAASRAGRAARPPDRSRRTNPPTKAIFTWPIIASSSPSA